MTVIRVAKTKAELANLIGDMIEVEHPTLDMQNVHVENDVLIIPTIIPDNEPVFEWEGNQDQDAYLQVYKCRKARLLIHNVVDHEVALNGRFDNSLLDIQYQDGVISIYDDYSSPLLQVKVTDLQVALEVSDEVVDILTLYSMPGGDQMLGYGDDMFKDLCQEAGIALPDIQMEAKL